jgi:hypothetical protein
MGLKSVDYGLRLQTIKPIALVLRTNQIEAKTATLLPAKQKAG